MEKLIEEILRYYHKLHKRPVFQLGDKCRFIIISQAPGLKVHETGIPWNDVSGKKLREWLGVTREQFYDKEIFSIMPMDFCYPGKGPHGDLPPDPNCARMWHPGILELMVNQPTKLLIGSYAIKHYLGEKQKHSLPETIENYKEYFPEYFPMPHPSPRNKNWLKNHSWFEEKNIPFLQRYIQTTLKHL